MKPLCTKSLKRATSLGSRNAPSGSGGTVERSNVSKHPEGCGCLTCPLSTQASKRTVRTSTSSTPGSLQQSKKTTLNAKKGTCEPIYLTNIPDPRLTTYQTSDQVSTLKDPDCYRFWDSSRKERYQHLSWLPETDWQGLDSSSSNGSAPNSVLKSWFSTLKIQPQNQNSPKTSWQSSKFTVVDGMENEDIPTKKTKCRKLRLKPNPEQKKLLNQWAGCHRFLYNKSIALLTNKKNKTLRNVFRLRDRFVTITGKYLNTQNNFYTNKPWLKNCPKAIKQGAITESKANLDACWTNLKNKNIKTFTTPFRSKKQQNTNGWSMALEKNNIAKKNNQLHVFPKLLGEMKYCKTKQLHKLIPNAKPSMDCKLQKTAYGEFFLIVPYTCTAKPLVKECSNPVAGDPGVRKFLTTYAPNSREAMIMGNRWSTRIMSLLVRADHLYSELVSCKDPKKRERMKDEIIRIRKQAFYLKKELKYQCANYLVKHYDMVMMPKLDSTTLVLKKDRKLKTKTVRQLQNAGHSEFFDILKDKCWEHGIVFLHCREEYTSQTCPTCGHLNKCNEVYHCNECGFVHDRDIVGALNIMLKGVRTERPSVERL